MYPWRFSWKRLAGIAQLVGSLLFMVGCAAHTSIEIVTETPVQTARYLPTITTISPTSSIGESTIKIPDSSGMDIRQTLQTSTPFNFSPSQTPENLSVFEICSPLSIHSLEELPEIISDPYHPPPTGKEERHQGVDFSYYRRGDRLSIRGVGVQSVLAGRVAMALSETFPYGNVVIVESPRDLLPANQSRDLGVGIGESLYILYAHFENSPEVRSGQEIAACQPLGEVGLSGNAGVPHLHIETRIGPSGTEFHGMRFYDTHATQEEKDTYLLWRINGVYRHFNPMDLLLYQLSPQTGETTNAR